MCVIGRGKRFQNRIGIFTRLIFCLFGREKEKKHNFGGFDGTDLKSLSHCTIYTHTETKYNTHTHTLMHSFGISLNS